MAKCGFRCRRSWSTVNMLDTYLPALLSVIYANELPKEAVARVEAGWRGHDRGDELCANVARGMLFVDGGGVNCTVRSDWLLVGLLVSGR